MELIVAVLVILLIGSVGFGCYNYADAQAAKRQTAWVESNDPSMAIVSAIRQTQTADQQNVQTVAEVIAASVKSMMGMDQPVVVAAEYPKDVYDELPTSEDRAIPFAELDPWFNDDLELAHDDMTADT